MVLIRIFLLKAFFSELIISDDMIFKMTAQATKRKG